MAPIMAPILEPTLQALMGAQAEIAFFIFAVCVHAAVFGNFRFQGKKEKVPASPGPGSKSSKGGKPSPKGAPPAPVLSSSSAAIVKALKPLLMDKADCGTITDVIEPYLESLSPPAVLDSLSGLLGAVGKDSTPELLTAVRDVVRARDLQPSVGLSDRLLKACVGLRLEHEFQEVLAEVEARGRLTPTLALTALKGALLWSDLDGALRHIKDVKSTWGVGSIGTVSAAPQQLLQRLARLALERNAIPSLLRELRSGGLIAGWTLEPLLSECARLGDAASLLQVEKLAREEGVQLTPGAFCALLRGATSSASVVQALEAAAAQGSVSDELLIGAAEAALVKGQGNIAEVVLRLLPKNASPATAAAVLRLAAQGGPLAQSQAAGAVIRLYEESLAGVDVLADARGARLVAEDALASGRTDVLVRMLTTATQDREHPSRCASLIKGLDAQHRLVGARAIFGACAQKTASLFNTFIDVCVECNDMKAAERAMAEATAAGVADVVSYNTIIKVHLANNNSRGARETMERMRQAGFAPNCVTFNELIDATIKTDTEGAWKIVEEMKASGVRPNHVTCSILLKSIQQSSKAPDLERVLAILNAAEDGMDEILLSSVCEACVRSNRADLLRQQLRRQRGPKKVTISGAHTYGSMIRAYGYVQEVSNVWQMWKEMKAQKVVPTSITIGCMVEALVSNGEVDGAYEVVRECTSSQVTTHLVNAVIYCSVLKGFCYQKRFDRVWAIYDEMRTANLQFSIVTYNTLINACAQSCNMSKATPLLEDMARQKIEPNVITYSTVLKGYCQESRLDKAFEVLEDMKKSRKFSPDEVTYNSLLDGCARHGLYDRGMSVLKDMEEAGMPPSNFTLSVLVKLANRSRQTDKAFQLVEQLTKKYNFKPNAYVYANLVHACVAPGDFRRGLGVLERMLEEGVRPDARTYALLLRASLQHAEADDTVGLLRAGLGLRDAHPRLARFGRLAQPNGGLQRNVLEETIEGIATSCAGQESKIVELMQDLRKLPGIKLDPKLALRLTSQATRSAAGR